jgi:proline racemase
VTGDVAWGGNWFFSSTIMARNSNSKSRTFDGVYSKNSRSPRARGNHRHRRTRDRSRRTVWSITARGVDSKNFVLCPGNAYDRSPMRHGHERETRLSCRRWKTERRVRSGDRKASSAVSSKELFKLSTTWSIQVSKAPHSSPPRQI